MKASLISRTRSAGSTTGVLPSIVLTFLCAHRGASVFPLSHCCFGPLEAVPDGAIGDAQRLRDRFFVWVLALRLDPFRFEFDDLPDVVVEGVEDLRREEVVVDLVQSRIGDLGLFVPDAVLVLS